MSSGIAIGIDLGTTNSCVGWFDRSKQTVEICPNEYGQRTMPSYVAFNDKQQLVGEAAVRQQAKNPANTLYETKRFIGRSMSDLSGPVSYPYKLIDIGDGNINFVVHYHDEDRVFCPEEIAAIILDKMRNIASTHLGQPVKSAVITVPAYFNDAQRQATRDAGRIAGLEVTRVLNEPTAAALAYGLDRCDRDKNVLVFDLGGGTFDTSILSISSDGVFEVRAISGDTALGGADFDRRLMDYVMERYLAIFKVPMNIHDDPKLHRRLRTACEKAKCDLSGASVVDIELDGVGPNREDLSTTISRAQFEELCHDLFKRCMDLVRATLKDAQLQTSEIDDVVLVGGSTRIPKVQSMLSAEFGGKELCKSINPDEAVAYGAAINAALLDSHNVADNESDTTPDVVLIDVCPLTLGVETTGGLMSALIERNTIVPVKRSKLYSTTDDNQTSVTINVFEGERAATADNRKLGSFELTGIQPAPRGTPKIRVSFELDADGIFTVSAVDETEHAENAEHAENSKPAMLIIQNKGRLSETDVQKYVQDAQSHALRDELFSKFIKLRTDFENLLFGVRRTFTSEAKEILQKHADQDAVQMVLDVVSEQFNWLDSLTNVEVNHELIVELQRRRDWVEYDVARSVVDAVNAKIC
jgi:L1 cell adhesion molecule like protein